MAVQYQSVPNLPQSRSNEMFEGAKDAARAVRNDKVVDLTAKISERDSKCQAGDAYSCGVASTLKSVEQRKVMKQPDAEVASQSTDADKAAGAPLAQQTPASQKGAGTSASPAKEPSAAQRQAENLMVGLDRSPVAKLIRWFRGA